MHFSIVFSIFKLFFFATWKKILNFLSPESHTESKSGKIQIKPILYTLLPSFQPEWLAC